MGATGKSRVDCKMDKKCKPIFQKMVISTSGDFGVGWEPEKMTKWITLHGGTFVKEVNEETTHLICTRECYDKRTKQVQDARKLGKSCFIVTRDWLEDCLVGSKIRARDERRYSLSRNDQKRTRAKLAAQKRRQGFDAGNKESGVLVDPKLYHVFIGSNGLPFEAVCSRKSDCGSAAQEKYTIRLFESHAKPHLYMAGAELSHGSGRPLAFWRDECKAKVFLDALHDFKRFFRHTTGLSWDNRNHEAPQRVGKFTYEPPQAANLTKVPSDNPDALS